MFDDAEKKIARLIAESTTSGATGHPGYAIRLKGQGNMVAMGDINLTFNITTSSGATAAPDQLIRTIPPSHATTTDKQQQAIRARCQEIGDPDLYRPFNKAAYGTSHLEDLAAADLGRLEWWLGLRSVRPAR